MTPKKRNISRYPYAALSNVGRVRDHNEDSILAEPPLYAVADGMGGHEAGEIASSIAVEQLLAYAPTTPDAAGLMRAVKQANSAIIQAGTENIGRVGMGTTMTSAIIDNGRAVFAQVGDSRAYLLRSGRLSQVTQDHSVVATMVRSGSISESEARVHPQRNVITRALGSDAHVIIDTYEYETLRGDRWLLCSDGLSGPVDDEHLEEILNQERDPRVCAEKLIEAANAAGGNDNISAIVIDVPADDSRAEARVKTKHTKKSVMFGLISGLLALIIILGIGGFLITYAKKRAYIAQTPSGRIGVYQGVPGSFFNFKISSLSQESTFTVSQLSTLNQQKVDSQEEFETLDAARQQFEAYQESLEQ